MGTLYKRIMSLCQEKGITGGKMCTELKMSKGTLTDLKMGRQTGLSAAKAQKIAAYFGVSVGYLLGEEEKEIKKEDAITDTFVKIVKNEKIQKATELICELTDEQLDIVIAMLSNFKQE